MPLFAMNNEILTSTMYGVVYESIITSDFADVAENASTA